MLASASEPLSQDSNVVMLCLNVAAYASYFCNMSVTIITTAVLERCRPDWKLWFCTSYNGSEDDEFVTREVFVCMNTLEAIASDPRI